MKRYRIKIVIVLLLALSVSSLALAAKISPGEALAKFVKAGFHYKDGQYAQAIPLYEDILTGGLCSAETYYNLGNSYFKNGDLGEAVLSYERARRLIPRDHDLRANYLYALSHIKNHSSSQALPFWQTAFNGFSGFYTVDEMALIAFLLALLGGVLYLLALYFPGAKNSNRIVILLLLLALIHLTGFVVKVKSDSNAAVIIAETLAKFEPRKEATAYFTLPEGARIKILKTDGIWVKIERPDGKDGWVPKDDVEKI